MRYATTFSGIAGWEIGLNAAGWDLAWQCEREPFCRTLLKERFGVPICPDIHYLPEWCRWQRKHGFEIAVDALIGSPPCQPFSVAGAQRGTSDERHLYPAFIRAVRFLRPRYVLMEQVPAILSVGGGRAFGEYIGGLAALGYDCVWHCIPASAVGAPHRRDRLWIIGVDTNADRQRLQRGIERMSEDKKRGIIDASVLPTFKVFDNHNELPTPIVCGGSDGIPNRAHRLRGLGNSVVPQIPFLLAQAINEIEGVML